MSQFDHLPLRRVADRGFGGQPNDPHQGTVLRTVRRIVELATNYPSQVKGTPLGRLVMTFFTKNSVLYSSITHFFTK